MQSKEERDLGMSTYDTKIPSNYVELFGEETEYALNFSSYNENENGQKSDSIKGEFVPVQDNTGNYTVTETDSSYISVAEYKTEFIDEYIKNYKEDNEESDPSQEEIGEMSRLRHRVLKFDSGCQSFRHENTKQNISCYSNLTEGDRFFFFLHSGLL